MTKKFNFKVEKKDKNQRIDKYLVQKLSSDLSRSDIKKYIQQSCVFLNSNPVKPHQKVRENDLVEIIVPAEKSTLDIPAVQMNLDIIFEDGCLLVINKPAGIVVHPAAGHYQDTLVNALLYHTKKLSDLGGLWKPGIVHRLDKDTSGLLVIAKDNKTHRHLAEQFKQHLVKKVYLAIVQGEVEHDQGVVEVPLSRSLFNRKKMSVAYSSGRQAITYYRVLERKQNFTVLEIRPETGRTHQIRVHLAHIGHPILGDTTYGGHRAKNVITRCALHAKNLGFIHPGTNDFLEFEAPVPDDMNRIISS